MVVTNLFSLPGYRIVKVFGIVKGSTVRGKHMGIQFLALLRMIIGGEIKEYTEMLNEARMEAETRMIEEAKRLGANAILNVKYMTNGVGMAGISEILAYGTAVLLEPTTEKY